MRRQLATLAVSSILLAGPARATVQTFTDPGAWLTAASGAGPVTTIHFDDIAHGTYLNDPATAAQLASVGVQFLPFGNGAYPQVAVNGGAHSAPNLIGNFASPGFDELANGFRWQFLVSVTAVGWYHNPGDPTINRVYDDQGGLMATVSSPASGTVFCGFVSDDPIALCTSIDVPPQDGIFGIDHIQFVEAPTTAAESSTWGAVKRLYR